MSTEEFDTYGATVRTLRGFIASYQDLVAVIRDFMLPNPDVGSRRHGSAIRARGCSGASSSAWTSARNRAASAP